MILIIYQHKNTVSPLLDYLQAKKIDFINLSFWQLINAAEIEVNYNDNKLTGYIAYKGQNIALDEISGIYHYLWQIDIEDFKVFGEDRIYAFDEWYAFLCFLLSKHKNVINPTKHQNFFGSFLRFPQLFSLAKKYQIKTPDYKFSTDSAYLKQQRQADDYISLNSLSAIYTLDEHKEKPTDQVLLQYKSGYPVIITIVDNFITATIQHADGQSEHKLSDELTSNCLALTNALGLNACHLFFKLTLDGDYYLYSATNQILFHLFKNEKNTLLQKLTDKLLAIEKEQCLN